MGNLATLSFDKVGIEPRSGPLNLSRCQPDRLTTRLSHVSLLVMVVNLLSLQTPRVLTLNLQFFCLQRIDRKIRSTLIVDQMLLPMGTLSESVESQHLFFKFKEPLLFCRLPWGSACLLLSFDPFDSILRERRHLFRLHWSMVHHSVFLDEVDHRQVHFFPSSDQSQLQAGDIVDCLTQIGMNYLLPHQPQICNLRFFLGFSDFRWFDMSELVPSHEVLTEIKEINNFNYSSL